MEKIRTSSFTLALVMHAAAGCASDHAIPNDVAQLLDMTEAKPGAVWHKEVKRHLDSDGIERFRVDLVMKPILSNAGFCTASVERYFSPARSCVSSPCEHTFEKVVINKVLLAESTEEGCFKVPIESYATVDGLEGRDISWVLKEMQSGFERRNPSFLCAEGERIVSIKRLRSSDEETFIVGLESDNLARHEVVLARSSGSLTSAECFEVL